jgi:transposase-like protein
MKKNQNYTAKFRAESVELGTEQNLSHQEAAARLGIPTGSLSNWYRQPSARASALAGPTRLEREAVRRAAMRAHRGW